MLRQVIIPMVLLGLAGGVASAANRPSPPPPSTADSENPYLELYRLRVAQAELNAQRQESIAALANSKFDRTRRLLARNAVAPEDYETALSEATVATADLDLARKKIDEAKAYLRIVDALVKRGVSIPLCTYEME